MPMGVELTELRIALLALFTVASAVPDGICAQVLDDATAVASMIDDELICAGHPERNSAARAAAVRALNRLCGECRACERGRSGEGAGVIALTAEARAMGEP